MYWCDRKKQHSQSDVRAIPTYHLSKSGKGLTKLVKLSETRNLLGFEYKLFLTYCVIFLSWEWVTRQETYSLWMPLAILPTLLKSEHLWISMLFTFLNFMLLHLVVFFCIINKWKVWGNSNFKVYYFHLDIMGMVRILDWSHKTITD